MSVCKGCGAVLKKDFRDNCYSCWKKNQTGNGTHNIKHKMKRLGETNMSGQKNWKDKLKQDSAQNKNYKSIFDSDKSNLPQGKLAKEFVKKISGVKTPTERIYEETERKRKLTEKYKVVD